MNNLIKFIFIYILLNLNATNAEVINKIILSIDGDSYTTIDLQNRKKYLTLLEGEFNSITEEELLSDFISINLFDIAFKKNKIPLEKIESFHDFYFSKYIDLAKDNEFNKIYMILGKDFILENIRFDINRNNRLQYMLNSEKDIDKIILENNINTSNIHDINVKFFTFDKHNFDKLNKYSINLDFKNINLTKEMLEDNNIEYLYDNKNIDNILKVNKKIRDLIIRNKKNIFINNDNNIMIGKINKIIKKEIESKIQISLFQINTLKKIDQTKINCENINELKNNIPGSINYLEKISYFDLNESIKTNINDINDFVIFKNNKENIYLLLCSINYDQEAIKKSSYDMKIIKLLKKIEKKFIIQNTKNFNVTIH